MMTLREALIWCLTSGVAKGDATLWGDPGLGHLCHAVRRPQLIRHSSMRAGPRGCYGAAFGFSQEKTPCVATLHRVFKDLDVAAFEAEVGNWLANSGVEADDPLSLDGKTLRGVHGQEIPGVHLVSAYASRAGAVLAQVAARAKGRNWRRSKKYWARYP